MTGAPSPSMQERVAAQLPKKPRTGDDPAGTLTIREWYAGQALKGLLASQVATDDGNPHRAGGGQQRLVDRAIAYADKMVASLRKEA
jgi:hypothetical protein